MDDEDKYKAGYRRGFMWGSGIMAMLNFLWDAGKTILAHLHIEWM